MKMIRSILIAAVCFLAGLSASAGWRMKTASRAVDAPREKARVVSAETKTPTAKTEAKRVFGRLESIAELTKALASSQAKGIEEWSKHLSATDAFLACEMLIKAPKSAARDKALRRSLLNAAASDPFRAFALFSQLGARGVDDDTRSALMRLMIKQDPKKTWETLSAARVLSKDDMEMIAREWGVAQGYASANFGLTLRDPIQRSVFLGESLKSWIGQDITSFSKWFAQQPTELGLERFVDFDGFSDERQHQPLTFATLDAAVALNVPVASSYLYSMFDTAWQDPTMRDQAAAWIGAQKDGEVRDVAWKELAEFYTETDHAKARALLPMITDEKMRQHVSSTLAAEMARAEPQEAMQFAATLSGAARDKAQASAMTTWAKGQPRESLAFIKEHPDQLPSQFLSYPVREWAAVEPVETLNFIDSAAGPKEVDHLLKSAAEKWVQSQPGKVDEWLAQAGQGRVRDAVSKARQDPPGATKLGGATWSGPNGEIRTNYGSPGESSTQATLNGKTVKFFY